MFDRPLRLAAFAFVFLVTVSSLAAVQYPDRPIHMIVGFAPGGGTDIAARMIAQKLADALGQPVVVENHPGAGGTTGDAYAAKAPPDGYTIVMTASGPHAIAPGLYKKLDYDVFKDFEPIALVAQNQYVLVVNPSVPAKTLPELIAWAKAQKEPPTYSSAGIGTPAHLAGELLQSMADIKLLHVPYRGAAPALNGLMAGDVKMLFAEMSVVTPLLGSDKLRAIAVTGKTRAAQAPEIPTMDESGLKGYEALVWYGLLAPAKTPSAVIARLNTETNKILSIPEIKEHFAKLSVEVAPGTPQAFDTLIHHDVGQWADIIKNAGIQLQQ